MWYLYAPSFYGQNNTGFILKHSISGTRRIPDINKTIRKEMEREIIALTPPSPLREIN